jgi:hypothetical protein
MRIVRLHVPTATVRPAKMPRKFVRRQIDAEFWNLRNQFNTVVTWEFRG